MSPAGRFRHEIGQALSQGAAPGDLVLHLTLGDASRLLRDHETPAGDISFEDAVMHFMGVKVQRGGVEHSGLERLEGDANG